MKLKTRNGYLKTIFFFMQFYLIFCQNDFEKDLEEFISSPKLIKNQLCSFNGILSINSKEIKCQCHEGFVKDNKLRKINNYEVDCSYQLKSRLITLVLSLIIPLGVDYFYLEHYSIFFTIFFVVIGIIIINIILLYYVLKYDKLTSIGNVDKIFEKKYIKFKYIVIIIDFISLCFYIINSILQGCGAIKDKNGFNTISDFDLF